MFEKVGTHCCFAGEQLRFRHRSQVLDCDMHFSIYLPPAAKIQQQGGKVPLLWWLSGLTCNDENFVQKAGAQRSASEHGIAVIAPDTSPRGEGVPDAADGAYDLGLGAGFYVNASEEPWRQHYRMYDYIRDELPALILKHFPIDGQRQSIAGHSMGGHGALITALRNEARFRSVSAFAPICAPMDCPWGEKAFSHYLGTDRKQWEPYDASRLIAKAAKKLPLLIDQGDQDSFLAEQLKPELLLAAAKRNEYPIEYKLRAGYDHSYFYIASFIDEHLAWHASHLTQ